MIIHSAAAKANDVVGTVRPGVATNKRDCDLSIDFHE